MSGRDRPQAHRAFLNLMPGYLLVAKHELTDVTVQYSHRSDERYVVSCCLSNEDIDVDARLGEEFNPYSAICIVCRPIM